MATAPAREPPLEGPLDVYACVFCAELQVLSLSRWRKVGLPLAFWEESRPNFKVFPKVSGVTTIHWVFLQCDWSPVSS